jgi:hypothetical protein
MVRRYLVRTRPFLTLALAAAVAASGCRNLVSSVVGPSETWRATVPAWSPYVVIQPDASAAAGYQDALNALTAHGAVHGARIALTVDGRSAETVQLALSYGLEVLGLIDNADLFRPDVEQAFDQYRATYPQIRIFQVGNEITTANPPMAIDAYIDVLARVYAHVAAAYPDVTLVTESTFGAGTIGAADLTALGAAVGPHGLSSSRLIFGINAYTETAITAYTVAVAGLPSGYRIWVTETGVPDQSSQVSYVNLTYPRLETLLRAERVYWYALWAGDSGGDSAYSLIKNAASPPIVPGPLFKQLTAAN